MAAGFRRLRRIVEDGNDVAAVGAIKLLAQLRGELTDKHDVKLNGEVNFSWQGKCPKPKK